MSQMSRKLNTIELSTQAEAHVKSQLVESPSQGQQQFTFNRNVLNRQQLNEMFSKKDIKKLKIAQKRNSVPCVSNAPLQTRKRNLSLNAGVSKKQFSTNQTQILETLNSGLGGLVLEAWPMSNTRTAKHTETIDQSKAKQSTVDRSSIQTLRTELNPSRTKVSHDTIPADLKHLQVNGKLFE